MNLLLNLKKTSMRANERFENLDLEFWANIKLLNQRLGYVIRKSKKNEKNTSNIYNRNYFNFL